jgi:hypothetical protein
MGGAVVAGELTATLCRHDKVTQHQLADWSALKGAQHTLTLTRSHTHTLTHSHAHTLTRSHAHTHTLTHSYTHTQDITRATRKCKSNDIRRLLRELNFFARVNTTKSSSQNQRSRRRDRRTQLIDPSIICMEPTKGPLDSPIGSVERHSYFRPSKMRGERPQNQRCCRYAYLLWRCGVSRPCASRKTPGLHVRRFLRGGEKEREREGRERGERKER